MDSLVNTCPATSVVVKDLRPEDKDKNLWSKDKDLKTVIPYTKFEHFGIIRFLVIFCCRQQTDNPDVLPMLTDRLTIGNDNSRQCLAFNVSYLLNGFRRPLGKE